VQLVAAFPGVSRHGRTSPTRRKAARRPLKRLALLWLACAAVGFAVAAGAAVVIALAFDRAPAPRSQPLAPTASQDAASDSAGQRTPGDNGQRLLAN
jgi:hypothetical protein